MTCKQWITSQYNYIREEKHKRSGGVKKKKEQHIKKLGISQE
jgi:hypothetical protein